MNITWYLLGVVAATFLVPFYIFLINKVAAAGITAGMLAALQQQQQQQEQLQWHERREEASSETR